MKRSSDLVHTGYWMILAKRMTERERGSNKVTMDDVRLNFIDQSARRTEDARNLPGRLDRKVKSSQMDGRASFYPIIVVESGTGWQSNMDVDSKPRQLR